MNICDIFYDIGCIEKSTVYEDRNTFIVYTGVGSAQSCQEYCKSNEKCNAWTYIKEKKNCRLQDKPGDRIHNKEGHESGPKTCKGILYQVRGRTHTHSIKKISDFVV